MFAMEIKTKNRRFQAVKIEILRWKQEKVKLFSEGSGSPLPSSGSLIGESCPPPTVHVSPSFWWWYVFTGFTGSCASRSLLSKDFGFTLSVLFTYPTLHTKPQGGPGLWGRQVGLLENEPICGLISRPRLGDWAEQPWTESESPTWKSASYTLCRESPPSLFRIKQRLWRVALAGVQSCGDGHFAPAECTESLGVGLAEAALPVWDLLISIFRSFLINVKGMFLFGITSHSIHIINSSDKWWMHKCSTFAQSAFSGVDAKCTNWISFGIAGFGMWRFAKPESHLPGQHPCGFCSCFLYKIVYVCGATDYCNMALMCCYNTLGHA